MWVQFSITQFRYISLHPIGFHKFWLHHWKFRYKHHELLAINFSKHPGSPQTLLWTQRYVGNRMYVWNQFLKDFSLIFHGFNQFGWTFSARIHWISKLNLWIFVTFHENWSPCRGLVLCRRCELSYKPGWLRYLRATLSMTCRTICNEIRV